MHDNIILDELGEILISKIYDEGLDYIEFYSSVKLTETNKDYVNFINSLSETEKKKLQNLISHILNGTLYAFLNIFELNDQFKLVYDNQNKFIEIVNLNEYSIGIINEKDHGWIDRFSKYSKPDRRNL